MTPAPAESVLKQLRVLLGVKGFEHLDDADLLRRFVERRDEVAFTVLVRRHGGRVRSVCQHVLRCAADADDAFQATFLILARKAASIRKSTSLASWLHGVALRCAKNLRKNAVRRSKHEKAAAGNPSSAESPLAQTALNELQSSLDEEIARLPEKYRAPFLLTCLEGKSRAEAAQILGCKEGTVASRVATARERLQKRLTARGISFSAALGAAALAPASISAGISAAIVVRTVDAAMIFAAGNAAGAVSWQVLAAVQGVLHGMYVTKLKLGVVMMFAASLTVIVGTLAAPALVGDGAATKTAPSNAPPKNAQPQAANEKPATKRDIQARRHDYGDSLPDGVMARLGSRRFRHDGEAHVLAFSRDGKTLVASTKAAIVVWDAATGNERYRVPQSVHPARDKGRAGGLAISPDDRTLAVAEFTPSDGKIGLWDLKTGRRSGELALSKEESKHAGLERIRFSPDGRSLAVGRTTQAETVVFDLATAKVRARLGRSKKTGGGEWFHGFEFLPNSEFLVTAVAGYDDNFERTKSNVEVWDIKAEKSVRVLDSIPPVGRSLFGNALAFSGDGKLLAWGMRDEIHLVDIAAGKKLNTVRATMGGVAGLAFTPDGKRLVSGGEDDRQIRVWDVATGTALQSFASRAPLGRSMRSLVLSYDAKTVAAGYDGQTVQLWDLATGQERTSEEKDHESAISRLAFSPDGATLASIGHHRQIHWHTATWKPIRELPGAGRSLAFSPDGKQLATVAARPSRLDVADTIRLWDLSSGKESGVIVVAGAEDLRTAIFSPDGGKLSIFDALRSQNISVSHRSASKYRLRTWDLAAGQEEGSREMPAELTNAHFAADGKTVAGSLVANGLIVADAASGQVRFQGGAATEWGRSQLSPDGRILAAATSAFSGQKAPVVLWDLSTGKEIHRLKGQEGTLWAMAWSPDGRMIATGDRNGLFDDFPYVEPSIRLWDVATTKELASFRGFNSNVQDLAFSPDGKTFVAGLWDGTILVMDAARHDPRAEAAPKLSDEAWDACWADLAGDNAGQAFRAGWTLVDGAMQSVPLLQKCLKPATAANAIVLGKLLADLDSGTFTVREAAMRQLKALGEQAEPGMRAALEAGLPLETKRRLTQLLDDLPAPETLRSIRAIAVLERIGSAAAVSVLETRGKGAPGTRTTEEAAAALARLRAKPAMKQ